MMHSIALPFPVQCIVLGNSNQFQIQPFYDMIQAVIYMKLNYLNIDRAAQIMQRFNLSRLASKVLASKQLSDVEIMDLLEPPHLSNPLEAQGIPEAVQRIQLALQRHEKVMVCGDYDCDGVCATAILYDALQRYGLQCGFYIPDRFKEGYGLHAHTVQAAYQKGYTLLITVDNGVKAHEALAQAKAYGIDVIVTDHHTIEDPVDCMLLVHPANMNSRFSTLSGAGVALLLSRALIGECKDHVILACIASIGDVMTVKQETRAIIKLGISYLQDGVRPPVAMLANDAFPKWDEQLIAFQIVPKLNVAGRLADRANVNNIVRFLLCTNLEQVYKMTQQIDELNQQRRMLSSEMTRKARQLVNPAHRFQMLLDDSFHEGLNGIVAGKLSEDLQLPVLVASRSQDQYKGSIRSLEGVDLRTFFQDCSFLTAYGGHEKAAGIAFRLEDAQKLQQYIQQKMEPLSICSEKTYDVIAGDAKDLSLSEIESLSVLAPFGEGFKEPLFAFENLPLKSAMLMGNGAHSKWNISDQIEAIQFQSKAAAQYQNQHQISLVGTLQISAFRGRRKISIQVKTESLSQ